MTSLIPASAQAFTFRMGSGFPGTISRQVGNTTVISNPIDVSNPPTYYGEAVVYDTTALGMRPVAIATDTAINGFVVRAFPTEGGFPSNPGVDPFGTANLLVGLNGSSNVVDVLSRGFISLLLGGSTAAKRYAPVYVWAAASSGAHVLGQVEAAATSGSTLLIPNAFFLGPADSNGVVEVAYGVNL